MLICFQVCSAKPKTKIVPSTDRALSWALRAECRALLSRGWKITGSLFPILSSSPPGFCAGALETKWMAVMTCLMKGQYLWSVSSRCTLWVGGWVGGVREALSTGAGISSVVALWISPGTLFCAYTWPVVVLKSEQVGNQVIKMPSAALRLQEDCSALGATLLALFCKLPWRHGTASQSPGTLLASSGKTGQWLAYKYCMGLTDKERVPSRPHSVLQGLHPIAPALTRVVPAKREAMGMKRWRSNSPTT